MAALRSIVSKKKVRYQDDGFDLDLTYITDRIIGEAVPSWKPACQYTSILVLTAMGAPTEGSEAAFRNPMTEVQRFFESKHSGHYKLFDLRAEKGVAYDADKFREHYRMD